MEVYLIRHTTPAIEKGLIYGRMDVPLAASFDQEKEILLKQLPSKLDAIYSSPSKRCCTLAKVLAGGYEVEGYRVDDGLYEMNFGSWEGKTWDTIDRHESERWMEDFVHLSPPQGESMLVMQQRVMQCWDRILQASHDRIAVVTHGGVIRIILAHYSHIDLKDSFALKVEPGSVFRLTAGAFL